MEYEEEVSKYENECVDIEIPIRMFITEGYNFLTSKVQKQEISVLKNEEYSYYITVSDSRFKISERKLVGNEIMEIMLDIDKIKKDYIVSLYIHDLNHSTKSCKSYPIDGNTIDAFKLPRKEAITGIYNLLERMKKIKNIQDIVDISRLYELTNLVRKEDYFPVISDEILTISWPCRVGKEDINTSQHEFFDIILNETLEKVGVISFDYMCKSGFSYGGNVSYEIKEQFRNNHYATRALGLLKIFLQRNQYAGDKDLHVATISQNISSQKVVLNNDGELIYSGKVPEDDSLNYIDGVEDVLVYRIKL